MLQGEQAKVATLTTKMVEAKHSGGSEALKIMEFLQVRETAMRQSQDAIDQAEQEKRTLAEELELVRAQLGDTIPLAQHSQEMERLKAEYDQVNKRAMLYLPREDIDKLSTGDRDRLATLLPKVEDERGEPRVLDLPQLVREDAQCLVEGTHVLVKYRPAGETKFFLGRLFFNDTKDYVCLGQGFEITSGIYAGRDRAQAPTDDEVNAFLAKAPLTVQIYLDAVANSAIQTVQFWLHELTQEQMLEIRSIDGLVTELLKDQVKITHQRIYEDEMLLFSDSGGTPTVLPSPRSDLDTLRRLLVQPIANRYLIDEREIIKRIELTKDKLQQDILGRHLKQMREKKRVEVLSLYEQIQRMLLDEEMVGRGNLKADKYLPALQALHARLTDAQAEMIKRDKDLFKSLMEDIAE
jgi:hypothetical protein